jgi:hypothetical protein
MGGMAADIGFLTDIAVGWIRGRWNNDKFARVIPSFETV